MDPEQAKRIANQCWQSGTAAVNKKNFDYAVEQFSTAARLVPDNLVYRQTLRGAEYAMYNNNGSGARMSGPKLMGIRSRVKKAKGKEDWKTMNEEAEKGLQVNPWDAQLEAWVGEACAQLGFLDLAIFAYSNAVKQEKEHIPYFRELANLHLEKRNYDEALRLYEKIYQLDPLDSDARSKQTEIQTMKTMDRGGYGGAETTRDVKAGQTAYDYDKKSAGRSDDTIGPGDDPESDLKRAIRKNPDAFEPYQKLADFYRKHKRLDECIEMFKQAHEKSGNNDDIREQMEDVQLEKLRNTVEKAREAAKKNPEDQEAQEKRQKLGNKLLKNEIQIFSERLKRHTQDSRLKYELAKRWMKIRRWGDAIKMFQQAVVDTRLETECYVLLGECFLKENKVPLAKRQFEKALPNLNPNEKKDLYLNSHYRLGTISENAGDRDTAEEHYNEILAIDYDYKDVAKRLDGLQGGDAAK